MGTQADAGKFDARSEQLRNADVRRRAYSEAVRTARFVERLADLSPEGFTAVVEALSQGDRALANQILRLWGIWR